MWTNRKRAAAKTTVPIPKKKSAVVKMADAIASELKDLNSAEIDAIQSVPGDTKAEKLKFLSKKSWEIMAKATGWNQVPTALHPLVNSMIVKQTADHQLLIDTLTSNDEMVVKRALLIDNFFIDENSPLLNFDFFDKKILAEVCLSNRGKIIRKLASSLVGQKPCVSKEFYTGIAKIYGIETAIPVLYACDEEFIMQQIIQHKININESCLTKLYKDHPDLVVSYLRLGLNTDKNQRDLLDVNIGKYINFIPCLMKNHFEVFVECWEKVGILNMTLSKTKKKLFIKMGVDVLKKKPNKYLKIFDLKLVTQSLSSGDFQEMIQVLLPEKKADFKSFEIFHYLQHFPEDGQLNLIKSVFKNAYGEDLYDNPDLVTKRLAFIIPVEDRIPIARANAEKEENWLPSKRIFYAPSSNLDDFIDEVSWFCFLPAKEVIPRMEKEILGIVDGITRENIMIQFIFCCTVNKDDKNLLRTLRFFEQRYKADSLAVACNVLQFLSRQHQLFNLSELHWESLNASIENVLFKNQLSECVFLLSILEKRIRHKLDRKLPIDEDIKIMAKIQIPSRTSSYWWILQDCADYSRLCLDKFILYVGGEWLEDENNHLSYHLVKDLITSIDKFNEKHKDNADVTPLEAKNYDYITKYIVTSAIDGKVFVKYVFKNWLPNMYDTYYPKEKTIESKSRPKKKPKKNGIQDVVALRDNYWKVKTNFKEHFDYAVMIEKNEMIYMTNKKLPDNVWKSIKWYQGLPSDFLELALVSLREEKVVAMQVFGNLLNGPQYEKILKVVIPQENDFKEMEQEDAKQLYDLVVRALTSSIKCNPPVSLDVFKNVMNESFKSQAVKYLYSVAHKNSVTKVLDFGKFLMGNDKISVKKHGLQLIYSTSSIDQKCTFLNSLLEDKTHSTIRGIVLLQLLQTFMKNPNTETWKILEACLERQTIDEKEVYKQIIDLKAVPNDYLVSYITLVLDMIKRYENLERLLKPDVTPLITTILNQIDHTYIEILSDDFLKMLIVNHVIPSVAKNNGCIMYIGMIFNVYLTGAGVVEKLLFLFENLNVYFRENPDEKLTLTESVKRAFEGLIFHYQQLVLKDKKYPQVTKAFKQIYDTCLLPKENMEEYVSLVLCQLYEETSGASEKFVDLFLAGFPSLIDILGNKSASIIGNSLVIFMDCLKDKPKNHNYTTIVKLLDMNTDASFTVALKLFMQREPEHTPQWLEILMILSESDFPTVRSIFAYDMYIKLAMLTSKRR